jgi:hypothetical protein
MISKLNRNCDSCGEPSSKKYCEKCTSIYNKKVEKEKKIIQVQKAKKAEKAKTNKEKSAQKIKSKEVDLEFMKGKNVALKPKKVVKSEDELEKEKKKKAAEKALRTKEKTKSKKEEKKYSMTNLFTLYQKFIRLTTPDICSSCSCKVGSEGRQKQAGHCHPKGKYKSTSILVSNIYSQCNVCNSPYGGNGMLLDLHKYGCNFWGVDVMDLVHRMTKISYSFNKQERLELFEYILEKIKEAEKLTKLSHKEVLLREVWKYQTEQTWFYNITKEIE